MIRHSQNIQVFVRCRPLKDNEKRSAVEVLPERSQIKLVERSKSSESAKNFVFDQVFSCDSRQNEVFDAVVKPLIDQVLDGYNCTVFAYGQTGTGKTYTMEGNRSEVELSWEDDPHSGMIPRAISHLFDRLTKDGNGFVVRVSFLELYNEDAYDLLSSMNDTSKLKIFDDAQKKGSVIVGGLEEIIVRSKLEIYDILKRGSAKRQTAATLLNACSSRSHTIFSITVHVKEGSIKDEELVKIGKLNLVDLAGSENIGRSGAQNKQLREAGSINQSLLALGLVINALEKPHPKHIPYRQSKLTRLLQDSLGGKTKTSIIATISPSSLDVEDTLSTLDYASRAKKITNKPEANQRLTAEVLIREYSQEIERLRRDLQATKEKSGVYIDSKNYEEICRKLDTVNSEKEEQLEAMQRELEKKKKTFEELHSEHEKIKKELERSRIHCERQKRLIKAQKEIERKLNGQAEKLLQVAEVATNDNYLLHGKKDRIESILKENFESIDRYRPELNVTITNHESLIDMFASELNTVAKDSYRKIKLGLASHVDLLNIINNSSQQLVESLVKESNDYRKSIDALQQQSQSLENQAMHYESLAKECKLQSDGLKNEIKSRLRIATERDDQARRLLDGISSYVSFSERMAKLDYDAEEDAKKLESITNTLSHTTKRELKQMHDSIENFFTRVLKSDAKTGQTPQRRSSIFQNESQN